MGDEPSSQILLHVQMCDPTSSWFRFGVRTTSAPRARRVASCRGRSRQAHSSHRPTDRRTHLLERHLVRQRDDASVALECCRQCETDARVARGGLKAREVREA